MYKSSAIFRREFLMLKGQLIHSKIQYGEIFHFSFCGKTCFGGKSGEENHLRTSPSPNQNQNLAARNE